MGTADSKDVSTNIVVANNSISQVSQTSPAIYPEQLWSYLFATVSEIPIWIIHQIPVDILVHVIDLIIIGHILHC